MRVETTLVTADKRTTATGVAVVYRHPHTGDVWILHPDSAGVCHVDVRVAGLMLRSGGYELDTSHDSDMA